MGDYLLPIYTATAFYFFLYLKVQTKMLGMVLGFLLKLLALNCLFIVYASFFIGNINDTK